MSQMAQLLFLVFYIASAYATAQEQTSAVASQVQRFSQPGALSCSVDADAKYFGRNFPNFKQAKPLSICALEIGQNVKSVFLPHISESVCPIQIQSLKGRPIIECALDRAPPFRS
jgi:hypothetical protein